MYLYLLKLGNDNGGYDVSITDMALSNILSITRKTVKPTREKLHSLGLIQFENKPGVPCSYRLVLDYPIQIQETAGMDKVTLDSKSVSKIIEKSVTTLPIYNIPKIAEDKTEESVTISKPVNHPSWEEFLEYAQTLEYYDISLDSDIKKKYYLWAGNEWKNAANRPITNWRSLLKSTLPYMKNESSNDKTLTIEAISKIERPTS